jgi:hypothetical protein
MLKRLQVIRVSAIYEFCVCRGNKVGSTGGGSDEGPGRDSLLIAYEQMKDFLNQNSSSLENVCLRCLSSRRSVVRPFADFAFTDLHRCSEVGLGQTARRQSTRNEYEYHHDPSD